MRPSCVIHSDRPATLDAQGILVCNDCYDRYTIERRDQLPFHERKFLHKLIKASADRSGIEVET